MHENFRETSSDLYEWLRLFHLPKMRASLFHCLVNEAGSPAAVLDRGPTWMRELGLPREMVEGLKASQSKRKSRVGTAIERDQKWLEADNNYIVLASEPAYPMLLKAIADPPPLLYLQGDLDALLLPKLAIVGTRKPTGAGRNSAGLFAYQLAQLGVGICSGLAFGIDSASHLGALDAKGTTLAVLGGGIDCVYPRKNRGLADRIVLNSGLLISEFPLGFEPRPWCFPQRNRVVTGLSMGVLVVEAALKSGSLVSAQCALEQGREVFAIPGGLSNPQAKGCHVLLKQGAVLVEGIEDILESLFNSGFQQDLWPEVPANTKTDIHTNAKKVLLNREQSKLMAQLGHEKLSLDSLVMIMELKPEQLMPLLVELELRGLIRQEDGGFSLA